MKRLAFLAAAAVLVAAPALAQQGFDQRTRPGARPAGGSGSSTAVNAPGEAQAAMGTKGKRTAKKGKGKRKSGAM
jgi:uncharacterized protein YdeI (BOF family)